MPSYMNTSEEILKSLESRKVELEKKVSELKFSEDELNRIVNAIAALVGNAIDNGHFLKSPYKASAKWSEKIKIALGELGSAGVVKLSEYICKKEPDLAPKHVYNSVAQAANKLATEEKISFKREGRGYIYSLKK